MELRFPMNQINRLATRYVEDLSERDRTLTEAITQNVFPSYQRKGFLTKNEFLTVCAWKTPRSKPACESNNEAFVKDISQLTMETQSEQLRIQAWTLLAGVKWPTASVFLHFTFSNRYPILDYRALWSLKTDEPTQYKFPFWVEYSDFCRKLAREARVKMRVLDQALWKYSDLHQKKK